VFKGILALASVLVGVAVAEMLTRAAGLGERRSIHEALTPLYEFSPDEEFGYVAAPYMEHRAHKGIAGGPTCYDVVYSTDRFGRRVTGEAAPEQEGHLLLFGGSVTFGEGLGGDDLLQVKLAAEFSDLSIHNYALPGFGPSHALARVRSGSLSQDIPSERGSALYFLIPAHVDRVIGTTRTPWVYDSPYFVADGRGGVLRKGSLRSARPWRTALHERFVRVRHASSLLQHLNAHLPLRISDDAMNLVVDVLAALRTGYRAQFRGDLWVVLHPLWSPEGLHGVRVLDGLRSRLAERGVSVLDYADYREAPEDRLGECDPHPSGILNERLARWIARDLRVQREASSSQAPPAGDSH
jgi:hypothetical protein